MTTVPPAPSGLSTGPMPAAPALPVGAFFLRHMTGWAGRTVSAMQGFVRGGSFWTHAGLILDDGQFIQGQPGGASLYPIGNLFDGQPLLVSDAPMSSWLAQYNLLDDTSPGRYATEQAARAQIVRDARPLVGADYSFLDYPVLGLAEWARRHPASHPLNALVVGLRHYVNSSGHLICSALVDRAYLYAGLHLFDDGRMPGDVTPEDLAEYAYADDRRPLIDTRENPS